MNGCIYRTKDNECELWEKDRNCTAFCHPNCENPHPSNADRIRAMTDEELADFLTGEDMCELLCSSPAVCPGHCKTKCLEWLRQEAEQ